jgi:hypothetical protein
MLVASATLLALSAPVASTLPSARAAAPTPTAASAASAATPIIPATTKVLSAETLQSLVPEQRGGRLDLRSASLQLGFARLTPDLQALRAGDVIVSGVTPDTPFGMLRKVTAVTRQGDSTLVDTSPAALTDAITQGTFTVNRSLASTDIRSFQSVLPGVAVAGSTQPQYPFCLSLTNVTLASGSTTTGGGSTTAAGSLTASGRVCAAINFYLSADISGPSVEHPAPQFQVEFKSDGAEMTDVRLTASGAVSVNQSYELGRFYLQPIVFSVFGVPVVITPLVLMTIGADGAVMASMTAGVTQSDAYEADLQCANDSCWATGSLPAPTFSADPISLSSRAAITGYGTPELDLLLYGVVGPELDVRGYVEADGSAAVVGTQQGKQVAGGYAWIIYGGLQVQIGIALDIVGVYHKDFSQTVYALRTILAQSGQQTISVPVGPTR